MTYGLLSISCLKSLVSLGFTSQTIFIRDFHKTNTSYNAKFYCTVTQFREIIFNSWKLENKTTGPCSTRLVGASQYKDVSVPIICFLSFEFSPEWNQCKQLFVIQLKNIFPDFSKPQKKNKEINKMWRVMTLFSLFFFVFVDNRQFFHFSASVFHFFPLIITIRPTKKKSDSRRQQILYHIVCGRISLSILIVLLLTPFQLWNSFLFLKRKKKSLLFHWISMCNSNDIRIRIE